MGYDNERFRRGEAPPSMAQVWTMPGLGRKRPPEDPLSRMTEFLTDEGYTAVLGTNCEQSYERYLRVGEQLRVTSALDSVAGPKNTAMGEGYFVTSRNTWYVAGRGSSRPCCSGCSSSSPGELMTVRPMVNRDSQFFWDGTRPASCGSRSATPAARSGSRPDRPASAARPTTAATTWPPAPARCSRTSCTGTRRSPARSCRS